MIFKMSLTVLAAMFAFGAKASEFTTDIPSCKNVAKPAIPAAYISMAKRDHRFAWALYVPSGATAVAGSGHSRADENSVDWYQFLKVDLNNDGYCDWYETVVVPISSGGDRSTFNVLYLGYDSGWRRIGSSIPDGSIDEGGVGRTFDDGSKYSFGEEIELVHDKTHNVNYVVASFPSRNTEEMSRAGYQIYRWDPAINMLALQDKWIEGSEAEAVYEFFRKNGGFSPGSEPTEDSIIKFEPEVEAEELREKCESDGAHSRNLQSRCQSLPKPYWD